ncbi:alpha/beta hydrolase [Streptomyces sp. NPDC090088]|uniref:alpha/beta hydrolase n=1 Tax=Streptomyces sp. NPDC090088 TaxID=3365944 RepID=UPI0038134FC4
MRVRITCWLAAAASVAAAALVAAPAADADTPTSYSGSTSSGGTWVADVPRAWNGTLLLFSHGFGPVEAADAPDEATKQALLNRGYALAGSSEGPSTGNWWTLGVALDDQFETLAGVRAKLPAPARQVIAVGQSMGGLISALENEHAQGRLDGVLTACGLVEGADPILQYQLLGQYAMSRLLAPGEPIKLVNFPGAAAGSGPAQGLATGKQLTEYAQQAQRTPQGRARLALAMAFLNTAPWAAGDAKPGPKDYAEQERQQYKVQFTTDSGMTPIELVELARGYMEEAAGGNASRTAGVDFARELGRSPYLPQVRALYRSAGLNLDTDLAGLTATADIKPDAAATRWYARTSQPSGHLTVPQLNLHTISDQLIPVQAEDYYGRTAARAESDPLLRQAYVERVGHCDFTPAELVAGVRAVQHRVEKGRWDDVATPGKLDAVAKSLDLGDAAYIPFRPAPLTGVAPTAG